MTSTCSRCQKTRDWYTDRFEREYNDARDEFLRLSELFKDVCWYNFETRCRNWTHPWRKSDPDSVIELHGMHFDQFWNKGRRRESGHFPIWFNGAVAGAPELPPQIVLHELQAAKEYMLACEKQIAAPYEWAPGGKLYEALRRQTAVGKP